MTKRELAFLGIATGLVLFFAGRRSGANDEEDARAIASARQVLSMHKSYLARQVKTAAIAQVHADSAAFYRQRSEVRGKLIAQLDTALSKATSQPDSFPLLVRQNGELKKRVADDSVAYGLLFVARRADSTRADLAEARVRSLEAHLDSVLTIAECRINLVVAHVPCPSRGTVAVLSAATTLVLDHVLSKPR